MEIFMSYILVFTVVSGIVIVFKSVNVFVIIMSNILHSSKENKKYKRPETNKYIDSVARDFIIVKRAANEFGFNNFPITIVKDDLKRRYREKVKKVHPDHGGSSEEFIRVKQAYDILLNRIIN